MYAVEFQAQIKNGVIEIPQEYQTKLKQFVRVILLAEEETQDNMIDYLLEHPLTIEDFQPLTREEIYERD